MAPPPDQPGRTGIVDGRLTYDRRTNPRRAACPWCKAPIAAPCRDVRGRDLSWYHADRTTAAEREPAPVHPDPTPDPRPLARPDRPDPPPLPAPVAPPRRTPTRQGQQASQPPRPRTERTRHQSCADWLTHQLATHGGTLPAHDLIHAAHTAGYSRTTLHRARTRLGITTHQQPGQPHAGWHWNLTPPPLEPDLPQRAKDALTQAGQMTLAINTRARAHRAPT